VKFIVDAQLAPSLAGALRQAGCDAVAVREIGLREARDAAIWQYALENHAAILTKDEVGSSELA
jgi:predicted nuclease of predicted toxin-antitoxin system